MHPYITEMLISARQQDVERSLRSARHTGAARRRPLLRGRHAAAR